MFDTIKHNLHSLVDLLHQLSNQQYSKSCTALSDASIGKHYRHIIEIFGCLLEGYDEGLVNYDHRARNQTIETNSRIALQKLEWLTEEIERPNKNISIEQTLAGQTLLVESNYYRELLFNLDHSIHHQALIKVGVAEYDNILLDEDFGVAPSTISYRKQNAG
ncbi:hypothetical protein [Fodinibius salsisoli]|uniref:DinB family protein n=1 Tax=Fodinibius salsisoli TaxID=2820877 RepID=A0ABT3PPB4_9BACT|nr:hypothetical protein [Fodinibius salsisoli]MCW9707702.1 hypothetical protein [Fodinibius salsisoli]